LGSILTVAVMPDEKNCSIRNVDQFNSDWNTLRETHPLKRRIHILQQILPYWILGITDPARDAVNSSFNCRCSTRNNLFFCGIQ
jgi:hypothetical protein